MKEETKIKLMVMAAMIMLVSGIGFFIWVAEQSNVDWIPMILIVVAVFLISMGIGITIGIKPLDLGDKFR